MSLQNLQVELIEQIFLDNNVTSVAQPEQNIFIYRNNIFSHLINTLKTTYPLILSLLGKDFFHLTAKEYIKQYPSRSANLHDYGEYVSDFIAEFSPLKDFVYLSEVAYFEWICHRIYFAANHDGFDTKNISTITKDQYSQLHFLLHPASQVVQFYYPILKIIDLCQNSANESFDVNSGGIKLLIIRRGIEIKLMSLEDADFAFLFAVQNGETIDYAFEQAKKCEPQFDLNMKIFTWVQDQTIVDAYLTD
ncbi:MAG: protein of unknown function DUF2063 [uncultured bacterium]|nr:MAG: protein of unknown function DUF2063 [uncultured bacterium]